MIAIRNMMKFHFLLLLYHLKHKNPITNAAGFLANISLTQLDLMNYFSFNT